MKKIVCLVCALVLFSGCAGAKKPVNLNQFLVRESIALTNEMQALAGDIEYNELFTTSEEIQKVIAKIAAQDYKKPEDVYIVQLPDTLMKEFLQVQGDMTVSDELLEKMRYKLDGITFAGMINGYSGVETLAAISMIAWGKSYIQPEGWTEDVMLLLDYDSDFASVVSFAISGDGVISASASFVTDAGGDLLASLTEMLGGIQLHATSLSGEELSELLSA